MTASTHVDIRHRPEGFERKCPTCLEFLPLTLEFWQPRNGMVRCKACWRLYHQLWQAGRHDEARREARRESNRSRYWAAPATFIAASRDWKARNRERVSAYNRAYKAAHRSAQRVA